MALAQLIPVGTGEASSGEFTVAAFENVTVSLNDASGPDVLNGARARIELKDPAGQFFEMMSLLSDVNGREIACVIAAPGTYRVTRLGNVQCGVFRAA